MKPTLTPGSPLAKAADAALQWGHSMETLTGTPLEQIQRTSRITAWLLGQGISPVIVQTPATEWASCMRDDLETEWMDSGDCWTANPPVGTPAFPESVVVAVLDEGDAERQETLDDGTEPHVILTASGILRIVLNHPILGPR
ncbi:hypothetical protein [Demequina salsinemoris]|uniref:hypothetical protein n=1 Tax=Demequina salsinemoris TaxID=577470 RepID=UPI000781C24C|nr:hypothetical protein [Demequina salsinemoris]